MQEGQGVVSAAIWDQKEKVSTSLLLQEYILSFHKILTYKSFETLLTAELYFCFCRRWSTILQRVPNYCAFYFIFAPSVCFGSIGRDDFKLVWRKQLVK